jgi:hypothetical protein
MTDNEKKLINMLRDHNNPEIALTIALTLICSYLAQLQSSATPSVADFREFA